MAVSKEVQDVLDKARAAQSYRASTAAAMSALQKQNDAQKAQIDDLTAKLQAVPTDRPLSDEDKAALVEAAQDLSDGAGDTSQAIDEAHDAIHDNITEGGVPPNSAVIGGNPNVLPPVGHAPDAVAPPVGEPIHTDEQLAANGPANAPAGGLAPLMPNMAFNPSPSGVGAGNDGQPSQVPVVETPGGFVQSGGGTTQRAPGSFPDSPSSSVVVPADPDAKPPASSADLAKTGLGDSSKNALTDAQGQQALRDDVSGQVATPPGGSTPPIQQVPSAASDPAVQQAQQDQVEQQRKAAEDQAAKDKAAADQAKAEQAKQAAQDKQPVENPS